MSKLIHYKLVCKCGEKVSSGAEEGAPFIPVAFECSNCSNNGSSSTTYKIIGSLPKKKGFN